MKFGVFLKVYQDIIDFSVSQITIPCIPKINYHENHNKHSSAPCCAINNWLGVDEP